MECRWDQIGRLAAILYGGLGAGLLALARERELLAKPQIERIDGRDRFLHHLISVVIGAGFVWLIYPIVPCLSSWLAAMLGIVAPSVLRSVAGVYHSTKPISDEDLANR